MCGLTGGDGDGELNGAEEPKDPGILTGAELWNWLLPKSKEINKINRETTCYEVIVQTCITQSSAHACILNLIVVMFFKYPA